jgi:hypothetical protein
LTHFPPGSACQTSHWKKGHNKECKRFAETSWQAVKRAAIDCCNDGGPHAFSRDCVPLLDKAIKLTWTLRDAEDMFALVHLLAVHRRGAIETSNPPSSGEEGKTSVSDTILRALRRLKWPPRMVEDDPFHKSYLRALIKLHGLGVHQEAAEELFRTRCHDVETWGKVEGWAAASMSEWVMSLLMAALPSDTRKEALVGQAKEVAARIIPLLGGPWGPYAWDNTCGVRTAEDCGRREQGPTS